MTNAENNLVGVFENTLPESADSDINGRITTLIGYKLRKHLSYFTSLTVFEIAYLVIAFGKKIVCHVSFMWHLTWLFDLFFLFISFQVWKRVLVLVLLRAKAYNLATCTKKTEILHRKKWHQTLNWLVYTPP